TRTAAARDPRGLRCGGTVGDAGAADGGVGRGTSVPTRRDGVQPCLLPVSRKVAGAPGRHRGASTAAGGSVGAERRRPIRLPLLLLPVAPLGAAGRSEPDQLHLA